MPRKPLKTTDAWAKLLQKELVQETKAPVGGKTIHEIQEELRKMKLPCGESSAHAFVSKRCKDGSLKRVTQYMLSERTHKKVRKIYYVPL